MSPTPSLLAVALLLAGCSADPASDAASSTGDRPAPTAAPEFRLASVDGPEMSLSDARKAAAGGPLVLVLGSASCPYSTQEVNELAAAKPGYAVLAVVEGTPAEVKESLPKGVPFPVLVDAGGRTLALYSVGATPSIVVLDGKGAVAYQGTGGYIPPARLADMAAKVARGEPVGAVSTAGG